MNKKVDVIINNAEYWKQEMKQLRLVVLECGLDEDVKWGKPCYSFQGKNIAVIQGFKSYCALLFFKGYLLSDADHILLKTGENTTVGRQVRFGSVKEVLNIADTLKAYIYEAIEIEKSGEKKKPGAKAALVLPEEFKKRLNKNAALKTAFNSLTPGRQRAYNIYFSQAKQSTTREARIDKYEAKILSGKGMDD